MKLLTKTAIILVILASIFAISSLFFPGEVIAVKVEAAEKTPKELVAIALAPLPPVMRAIANCESTQRHWQKNGNVLIGDETGDVGLFQISPTYQQKNAQRLGIDFYTLEGNVKYAMYLYNKNGTSDWRWSRSCWSKLI